MTSATVRSKVGTISSLPQDPPLSRGLVTRGHREPRRAVSEGGVFQKDSDTLHEERRKCQPEFVSRVRKNQIELSKTIRQHQQNQSKLDLRTNQTEL
jgi:hypothetical protein